MRVIHTYSISSICINLAFIFAEKSNLNQLPISSVLYATSDACAATYMQHMLTSCTGLFSRGFYLCCRKEHLRMKQILFPIQYVYSSELIADICKQPVRELCLLNNVCCPRLSDAHWLQH